MASLANKFKSTASQLKEKQEGIIVTMSAVKNTRILKFKKVSDILKAKKKNVIFIYIFKNI